MITNQYYKPKSPAEFNAQKAYEYSQSLTNADPNMFGYTPDFNTVSQEQYAGGTSNPNLGGHIQAGTQLAAMGTSLLPVDSNPYTSSGVGAFKGMAQGAQMGAQLGGPVGAAVGAIGGIVAGGIGEVIGQTKALKNVNTNVNATQYSATGQPVYMGDNVNKALGTLNDVTSSRKSGDVFNRRLKRNTQNNLSAGIQNAQTGFNEAASAFDQEQIARSQYRDRRNLTNRMYNLYSA